MHRVGGRRQRFIWTLISIAAVALLVAGLLWQREATRSRWSVFLTGDPHAGRHLFEEKGCGRCHTVNERHREDAVGPDLGFERPVQSSVNQLVAAMWNHAPRMWQAMDSAGVPYPDMNEEDMAHLFAYLYTARYVEEPGDPMRGRLLFENKKCGHCHGLHGKRSTLGPDLARVSGRDTPIVWTQAMWNHGPMMKEEMERQGLPWPTFQDREMNDLLAYIRDVAGGPRREFHLLPASPERGEKLFRRKSCIQCHTVRGEGGEGGPELAPRSGPPVTFVQFAGLMWNHSPEMWRAMEARGIARPTFEDQEMADLFAYLYSVGFFKSAGSPSKGRELFAQRGCSYCHGTDAEGTSLAPGLRAEGRTFTATTLATALWRHGPEMYQRAQEVGRPWPTLGENDVADLIAFLNSPQAEKR